jgi:peroxiredoxin
MNYNFKIKLFQLIKISTLFIFLSCDNSTAQQKKNVNVNKTNDNKQLIKAPEFTLADLEGNLVNLSDLKGKVVMLNFWGTWCGPCRREIPDFVKLIEKHQASGLEILGVTLSSGSSKNIQSFADQWNINYTLLTDIEKSETQIVTSLYGQVTGQPITGIPTTFIIDREGFIRKKYVGPRSEKVFFKDLEPLL